jgi:hypothetical protein
MQNKPAKSPSPPAASPDRAQKDAETTAPLANSGQKAKEIGGPEGPEPTRYGDWERKGRVSDF